MKLLRTGLAAVLARHERSSIPTRSVSEAPSLTLRVSVLILVAGLILVVAFACALHAQTPHEPPTLPGAALVHPRPRFLVRVGVDHADGVYVEGDILTVKLLVERDAYLYLLYYQADGRISLLFPNKAQPDNRVRAKKEVQIPGPDDRFRIRARPPLGREVLQVLAALRPIEEFDKLDSKQDRAAAVALEMLPALARRLAKDADGWTEHRVPIRTVAAEERPPARKPIRAGLFIGVGKYLQPELAPTHEELRHSAEVMHKVLLDRGGLDPQHTKLVTDEQATKKNLETLILRWLPSVTEPGDTAFIYFSGHAGQFANRTGAEASEQDTVLGPYDLSAGAADLPPEARLARFRDSSILDDTLGRWLEELSGRQIVLILDTCHAGGVVEGKRLANRFSRTAGRLKDIAQLNTVVLTSTASDEQALFEGTPNKTMWFTYFLAEAVEKLPRPVTVQAAHDYCKKGLQQLLKQKREPRIQEPQLTDTALLPIALVP